MKILVVDDEKVIVKGIKYNLEQEGYQVVCAYDGEEAVNLAKDSSLDLILLDVMLPKMDGLTACRTIREFSNVPIRSEDIDKILGLEYGADDYITKPFNIREVTSRIKAILRRVNPTPKGNSDVLVSGDITLDYNFRRIKVKDKTIELTGKEFERRLDEVQITVNKNSIPNDPEKPFVTSGIRVGTPAVTSRGFKEEEMVKIAKWMTMVATDFEGTAEQVRAEVNELCARFPLYE